MRQQSKSNAKVLRRTAVFFAILVALILLLFSEKEEEERFAWTVSRLHDVQGNPTLPVLYLAGEVTSAAAQGNPNLRTADFEIFIRGTDYYFMKYGHGDPTNRPTGLAAFVSQLPFLGKAHSGWWRVVVVAKDFQGTMTRRWGRFGSKGGGGYGDGRTNWLAPGRRLWNSNGFIGAVEEGQTNKEWYASETFKNLREVEDFKIPQIIEFRQHDALRTFRIKKVEFRNEPAPEWFLEMKEKYFPEPRKLDDPKGTTNQNSSLNSQRLPLSP